MKNDPPIPDKSRLMPFSVVIRSNDLQYLPLVDIVHECQQDCSFFAIFYSYSLSVCVIAPRFNALVQYFRYIFNIFCIRCPCLLDMPFYPNIYLNVSTRTQWFNRIFVDSFGAKFGIRN